MYPNASSSQTPSPLPSAAASPQVGNLNGRRVVVQPAGLLPGHISPAWANGHSGNAGGQKSHLGGHRVAPQAPAAAPAPLLSGPARPFPAMSGSPPQHWRHRGSHTCQMNVIAAHRYPPAPPAASAATAASTAAGH